MLENFQGDSWGSIPPLHMPSLLPHDLCHGRSSCSQQLWPPYAKSWLIGKDSDARRDWGQEEKGTTEDEMAGWHHWLDGHEFEWTTGVGDGQGGLVCCDSWGCEESDRTKWLNWTELNSYNSFLKLEPGYLLGRNWNNSADRKTWSDFSHEQTPEKTVHKVGRDSRNSALGLGYW